MIFSKKFANLFYVCIFLTYLLGEYLIGLSQNSGDDKISKSEVIPNIKITTRTDNYLHLVKEKDIIPEKSVTKYYDKNYKDYIRRVKYKGKEGIKNVVAIGIDKKYHLSNSYLEGYAPFQTDNLWVPLQTIARKKTYQLDHLQYSGYKEVWQTSSQAFKYTRGDCEDHAIALADWLISMGHDARVVLGKYKNSGHAWVILYKDNKEYILEATAKGNLRKAYYIAKYQTKYKAEMMFNKDAFWVLKKSKSPRNYSAENWTKQSLYIRKKSS